MTTLIELSEANRSSAPAAAERRLSEIKTLTAHLRLERLVPQFPLAAHIPESESALSAQPDQAIQQLDVLQTNLLR